MLSVAFQNFRTKVKQVHQLQSLPDGAPELGEKANEIYQAHFGASAPYEINLPTTLLKQHKTLVAEKKFSREMFNESQVTTPQFNELTISGYDCKHASQFSLEEISFYSVLAKLG